MLTQKALLDILLPLLKTEGAVYQKNRNVFARPAQTGETIQTRTGDGLETTNEAGEGDFIVRNQTAAQEEYIVPAHKFLQKYEHLQAADDDWQEYRSLGRIIALELTPERLNSLGLPAEFEFIAPWDAPMTAKAGDFIGCPENYSEVYRLARKEFFDTYAKVTTA